MLLLRLRYFGQQMSNVVGPLPSKPSKCKLAKPTYIGKSKQSQNCTTEITVQCQFFFLFVLFVLFVLFNQRQCVIFDKNVWIDETNLSRRNTRTKWINCHMQTSHVSKAKFGLYDKSREWHEWSWLGRFHCTTSCWWQVWRQYALVEQGTMWFALWWSGNGEIFGLYSARTRKPIQLQTHDRCSIWKSYTSN